MLNAIETRTPPTIEDLAGISSDASRVVEAIVAEVVEIDKALMALDELLNVLQPPRTGKIRVEWWERRGRRVPTPVIWSHSKAGWRAERVSGTGLSRRVKSSRDFHDNYSQVKAVCQNVTKLLTMREQALAPIAMLQRTTAGTLSSNGARLTLACMGIDLAMAFARRQLGAVDALEDHDDDDLREE